MDSKKTFLKKMGDQIGKTVDKDQRLYFEVENEKLFRVVEFLFNDMGCRLSTATATEVYKGIEVLYHFSDDKTGTYLCPRITMTDKKDPKMNSITPIIRGAEWIEREMAEMFGIKFEGHPRKEPLLSKNNPNFPKQPLRIRSLS